MFPKLWRAFRRNTMIGLFLIAPVGGTYLILRFLLNLATGWVPQAVRDHYLPEWLAKNELAMQLMILFVVMLLLCLFGFFVRNIIGRKLYRVSDRILTHIPLVRSVYVTVRQLSTSLFSQRQSMFKEVVIVQYPRKGLYSIAFVTSVVPPTLSIHVTSHPKEECVTLFVPTTPNPTSGILILVPRSEVNTVEMDVADALTYVMSGGAVSPETTPSEAPTLLDKLEHWISKDDTILEPPDAKTNTE